MSRAVLLDHRLLVLDREAKRFRRHRIRHTEVASLQSMTRGEETFGSKKFRHETFENLINQIFNNGEGTSRHSQGSLAKRSPTRPTEEAQINLSQTLKTLNLNQHMLHLEAQSHRDKMIRKLREEPRAKLMNILIDLCKISPNKVTYKIIINSRNIQILRG